MKRTITFLILLLAITSMNAQKVKLKKGKISVDGVEVFNYELNRGDGWISIYNMSDNEEVIFIRIADNGTNNYPQDDYTIYKFLKQDVVVEVSGYTLWKNHVKFLLKNNVFDTNGLLNDSKIDHLKSKFDENITEKTVRN